MIPDWRLEDFVNLEPLGKGEHATVYRAVYTPTRQIVTLKCLDKSVVSQQAIEREISIHRSLDHPLICEYFGRIDLPDTTIIVLEYVKGFTLLDAVDQIGIFSEEDAQKMFCQVLSAVKYLHTLKDMVHLDLKLENMLMTFQRNVKLIDFGSMMPDVAATLVDETTPEYMSPEVFLGKPVSKKTDIWFLGVVLYTLVVGDFPFDSSDPVEMKEQVMTGKIDMPDNLSPELVNLLTLMLHRDSTRRISLEQIEKHPWLSKTRSVAIMAFEVCMSQPLLVFPDQTTLDEEVLDAMEHNGMNVSHLTVDHLLQNDDKMTMMYRIIKRSNSFVDIQRMYHSVMIPSFPSGTSRDSQVQIGILPKIRTAEPIKKHLGLKFANLPRAHKTPVPHKIVSGKSSARDSSDSLLVDGTPTPPTQSPSPSPAPTHAPTGAQLETGLLEKAEQPRRRFMTLAKTPLSSATRCTAMKLPTTGKKKSIGQLPIVTPTVNILRKSSFVLPVNV